MKDPDCRLCLAEPLDPVRRFDGYVKAYHLHPDGHPAGWASLRLPVPEKLAWVIRSTWPNGQKIRVRFLTDVSPYVRKKVMTHASEWSEYANVTFEESTDADAEVRVTTQFSGSWSLIGTDCAAVPASEATMNFGWFQGPMTPDEEYRRVIVHEVGHALGFIHEHQNPTGAIRWNTAAVYRFYGGPPNNWSQAEIDSNVLQQYSRDVTNGTAVDPLSIMMYPIPRGLADIVVGMNTGLSPTDRSTAGKLYPKKAIRPISVDGDFPS